MNCGQISQGWLNKRILLTHNIDFFLYLWTFKTVFIDLFFKHEIKPMRITISHASHCFYIIISSPYHRLYYLNAEITHWFTYLFTFWHISKLTDPYSVHWKLWQLLLETDNLLDNQTLIPNSFQNRCHISVYSLLLCVMRKETNA